MVYLTLAAAVAACAAGCATDPKVEQLDEARAAYETQPENVEAIIWYGRRLAYLGRYEEAIAVYSEGLEAHPDSYKLLRHRGHRYITTRQFEKAEADLQRAAELIDGVPDEVESDGMPNAAGVPRSTSHTNIYYHLALAQYLQAELAAAAASWERCQAFSKNDDMLCATLHWRYMTLRRIGDEASQAEAAALLELVHPDMDILENFGYHQCLLFYKGDLSEEEIYAALGDRATIDSASVGYGIANWHFYNGRTEQAREMFGQIVADTPEAAFGHIAAEADLARLAPAE